MLEPNYGRVVLKKLVSAEQKTPGGLVLQGLNRINQPEEAVVVAVGPPAYTQAGTIIPSRLKEGMKVLIPRGIGHETTIDSEILFIVYETEILGNFGATPLVEWVTSTGTEGKYDR